MRKRFASVVSLLVLLVSGWSAFAQNQYAEGPAAVSDPSVHYGWADVLRVDPIFDTSHAPAPRDCYEQPQSQPADTHSSSRGATILGAIVGGVLGHTIGKGDGRKAATVAGAVVGGAVGHGIASNNDGDTASDSETYCDPVVSEQDVPHIVAYDVEYRYRGEIYVGRLNYDPGDRLRVRVSVSPAE